MEFLIVSKIIVILLGIMYFIVDTFTSFYVEPSSGVIFGKLLPPIFVGGSLLLNAVDVVKNFTSVAEKDVM